MLIVQDLAVVPMMIILPQLNDPVVGLPALAFGVFVAGMVLSESDYGHQALSDIIPLAVGLGLFQIGEFSFVLARLGLSTGSIGNDLYALVLTATILSMALTPLISNQTAEINALKKRWFRHESIEAANIPDSGYRRHVVIAGGGQVGFQIAQILKRLNVPFIIIELDHRRFGCDHWK
jgi:predicted Kef-type K+ transport protein